MDDNIDLRKIFIKSIDPLNKNDLIELLGGNDFEVKVYNRMTEEQLKEKLVRIFDGRNNERIN